MRYRNAPNWLRWILVSGFCFMVLGGVLVTLANTDRDPPRNYEESTRVERRGVATFCVGLLIVSGAVVAFYRIENRPPG